MAWLFIYLGANGFLMIRTLVVYASRYGSTEEVARDIALVLGPSKCISCHEFGPACENFEMVVLGGPIYSGEVLPELDEFVGQHHHWISSRHLAMFIVGLDGSDSPISEFCRRHDLGLIWSGTLGGRLDLCSVSPEDYPNGERYLHSIGHRSTSVNLLVRKEGLQAAMDIKTARDLIDSDMDENSRRQAVEGYLRSRSTCVLATHSEFGIRATPLEYHYFEGAMYILTEGGEKMAHLMLRPDVSVAVNDEFKGKGSLFGLQLRGRAEIITPSSSSYDQALKDSGYDPCRLRKLPFDMCLIKIDIIEAELLSSALQRSGRAIRQRVLF
ncbi:MAG: Flavodoxin domain protein [Methanomassiliicoccales archaeon PtaU1.Bin124]|nr:MAG: Flavodoxin domain protein [Methanomassiliicoccales archaeon PtaU1.Bin124]